jgi:hypothetical protein
VSSESGLVRRLTAESVVCSAVAAVYGRARRTERRIAVGLGADRIGRPDAHEFDALYALAGRSRVLSSLFAAGAASARALVSASVSRWLSPALTLDYRSGVRLFGCALVAAAATHGMALALFGVPVHFLGWSVRAGLVAVGALMMVRPEAWTAAWRGRA